MESRGSCVSNATRGCAGADAVPAGGGGGGCAHGAALSCASCLRGVYESGRPGTLGALIRENFGVRAVAQDGPAARARRADGTFCEICRENMAHGYVEGGGRGTEQLAGVSLSANEQTRVLTLARLRRVVVEKTRINLGL